MDSCLYGVKSASFGKVLGLSFGFGVSIVTALYGWCFLSTFVLFEGNRVIGNTGLGLVPAFIPLFIDIIARHFPTWKYFGPGPAYIRGQTGNRWAFIVALLGIIIPNLWALFYSCMILLVFYFNLSSDVFPERENDPEPDAENVDPEISTPVPSVQVDERSSNKLQLRKLLSLLQLQLQVDENNNKKYAMPNEIFGFLLVIATIVLTSLYFWKYGVISYFIGKEGDSLNMDDCSGPEAWQQTNDWSKAVLILPFVLWIPKICLRLLFGDSYFVTDIAFLIVASVACAKEENQFHRSLAIFEVAFASAMLIIEAYVQIRKITKKTDEGEQVNVSQIIRAIRENNENSNHSSAGTNLE